MTDERHMDETQPEQAREPDGFGDLPMRPTGSGVADEETAFEQAQLDAPPEGMAGDGNTGRGEPRIAGGQSPVGEPNVRETRDTEF